MSSEVMKKVVTCSFCHSVNTTHPDVLYITGGDDAVICSECVASCVTVLADQFKKLHRAPQATPTAETDSTTPSDPNTPFGEGG
jgi:hypothetical protein